MRTLTSFSLEGDKVIWIEVDETAVPANVAGESEASRVGDLATKATQTFKEAIESVKPAVDVLIKGLDKISDSPDEIGVEFGLKVNGQVGTVIAASSVEANFKVTLKWTHNKKSK
jgi:hypothetical protein